MLVCKSWSQLANPGEEAWGGTDKCPSQSDSRQLCVFFPPPLMPLCILSPPTNTSLGITFINSIMLSSYVNCGTIHSCLLTSQRQLWIVQTQAVLFCFDQSRVLFCFLILSGGTSLEVQWLRTHLAMQGRLVWSLVRELRSHMLVACLAATTEPEPSGAHVPQVESLETPRKDPMWCSKDPVGCNWDWMESNTLFVHCSVAQSCPTLCDPMDCSMPGFPVLHHFPGFAQTHVH